MARSSRRQNQKPLTSRGPELPAGPVDIASGTVELVAERLGGDPSIAYITPDEFRSKYYGGN